MAEIRKILSEKSKQITYDPTKKITQTEIDAWTTMIQNKIKPCWNPPVGAKNAGDLRIVLRLYMRPNGTVERVENLSGVSNSDSYRNAALGYAMRAVKNPRCQPFDLPADRYDAWKTLKFNFDPSQML